MEARPHRILIIDDSPEDRETYRRRIAQGRESDFLFSETDSGEDGLRRYRAERPDCVVLDYSLPDLDGLEFLARLRAEQGDGPLPVVMLTGQGNEMVAVQALKTGAQDYLVKSRAGEGLRHAVQATMEKVALRRQVEEQRRELERGAQALRESEERYRLLVEGVTDYAIVMLDPEGRIVSWSVGARHIKGYRDEEILGRYFSCFYTPDDIRTGKPEHDLKVAQTEGRFEEEGRRVRKDGSRFWASVVVTALCDEAGHLRGFAKVTRDISDRKRAEEVLQEADRHKDEFLAMLAHELRNPLASIDTAVHLLQSPGADEHRESAQGVIERQVKHLSHLVDDLLDVSRITRGQILLRKDLIDPFPVLNGAIETVKPLIEERKHKLTISFTRETMRLEADPTRLEQIVVNLLGNAAKYTDPGGRIWLEAEPEGEHFLIRVRDTGIGIPPDVLPQMFGLFAQGDRSLARSEGGLGIGLTLVKKLTELHGGSITASSAGPGQGSEFTVRLPAALRPPTPAAPTTPTTAEGQGRGSRVLIVDDNVDLARNLATLLSFSGHDVRTAYDGPSALEAARVHRPYVALLDIGLPGMDGYQVAEQLRREDFGKDMLLIAITGYGHEEDQRRSLEVGFNHHLVKPVQFSTLLTLLAGPTTAA